MENIRIILILTSIILSIAVLHILTLSKEELLQEIKDLEKKFLDSETFKEVKGCWKEFKTI